MYTYINIYTYICIYKYTHIYIDGQRLHLFELVLERLVRELLARLLEQVVAEVGEELCGLRLADVLVDEDLEGLLHRLVEDAVPLESNGRIYMYMYI